MYVCTYVYVLYSSHMALNTSSKAEVFTIYLTETQLVV
jgi:hypothetical protein